MLDTVTGQMWMDGMMWRRRWQLIVRHVLGHHHSAAVRIRGSCRRRDQSRHACRRRMSHLAAIQTAHTAAICTSRKRRLILLLLLYGNVFIQFVVLLLVVVVVQHQKSNYNKKKINRKPVKKKLCQGDEKKFFFSFRYVFRGISMGKLLDVSPRGWIDKPPLSSARL